MATFWDNKNGYFAVDLAEKNKILFSINNFAAPFEVTDNKDIFIIHEASTNQQAIYLGFLKNDESKEYCFDGDFYDYVYFQNTFKSPAEWKSNSFSGASFNNKRWVAGVAQNKYGEQHAVLLVPLTE